MTALLSISHPAVYPKSISFLIVLDTTTHATNKQLMNKSQLTTDEQTTHDDK